MYLPLDTQIVTTLLETQISLPNTPTFLYPDPDPVGVFSGLSDLPWLIPSLLFWSERANQSCS